MGDVSLPSHFFVLEPLKPLLLLQKAILSLLDGLPIRCQVGSRIKGNRGRRCCVLRQPCRQVRRYLANGCCLSSCTCWCVMEPQVSTGASECHNDQPPPEMPERVAEGFNGKSSLS